MAHPGPPVGHTAVSDARAPGSAQFGNLEANLLFLTACGALRRDAHILEIGSGTGTLLSRLKDQGYAVQGVELDPALIAESRRWHGELPLQRVQGTSLPFPDRTFDIVMSFDVFEHIPDSDAHLQEVSRVLRPGGHYLLQTPNKWTNVVFETIRWRSFTRFRQDHCSLHSLAELRHRLGAHGFTVQAFDIPVVNAFFREKMRRYVGRVGVMALVVANPDRLPMAWRTNLYVAATLAQNRPTRP
jgi:SAM-dependent methyltransferase